MRTWLLTLGALILVGLCLPTVCAGSPENQPAPATSTGTPVIRSQAQLKDYLARTPRNAPPLGWLSPGGRKRFLAGLKFGPRGLAGIPVDDPESELTHTQLVVLFELFGVGSVAKDMPGLTPAEQSRRQNERRAAAKARGCKTVATCPESHIERQYDKLVLQRPDRSLSDSQRASWQAKHYDWLIAPYQSANDLASVDRPDLRLLKRAADHVVFWNPNAEYIGQLRDDLAEMQRRGMTDDRDFTSLYRALVAGREFVQAQALAKQHPDMGITALPKWQAPARLPAGSPTALSLAADGRTMTRKAFDLSKSLRIVIVASCHFSQDAARAIKQDPQLQPLFAEHAIWLADQGEPISNVENWNRQFPAQPIHVAWRNGEWSKLDSWAMPTFYVFRHGKLIDQWAGWPADTGKQTLLEHLKRDGVLPTAVD